jgi:hypothetical protein
MMGSVGPRGLNQPLLLQQRSSELRPGCFEWVGMVSAASIAHAAAAAANGKPVKNWAETISVLSWRRLAMLAPPIRAVQLHSHAFIRGYPAGPACGQILGGVRILFHTAPTATTYLASLGSPPKAVVQSISQLHVPQSVLVLHAKRGRFLSIIKS